MKQLKIKQNVSWIIEKDIFDYDQELVQEIKRQGMDVYFLEDNEIPEMLKLKFNGPVLFLGSLQLVEKFNQMSSVQPGVFSTFENYSCSNYYPELEEYLLIKEYCFISFEDLKFMKKELFSKYGINGTIFVRPDSSKKLFSGQLVHENTFEKDYELMAFYDVPGDTRVLVSRPYQIQKEFRFVMTQDQVISGSMYQKDGSEYLSTEIDKGALELANKIAKGDFYPDSVWVLDICQTLDRKYHVLEIGCFSYADLYLSDKNSIVKDVSEILLRG